MKEDPALVRRRARADRLRPLARSRMREYTSRRLAAKAAGVSATALGKFLAGETPYDWTLDLYEGWIRGADNSIAHSGRTTERVREEAAKQSRATNGLSGEPPSFDRLEWLPELLGEVIRDRTLTTAEKVALMGEVNAGGMRYWAVAAEWASGQRGMAVREDAGSAGTRALSLRPEIPTGAPTLTGHKRVQESDDGAEEDVA